MVAIIDYGAGNLMSVKKALDFIGAENIITDDKKTIMSASHIILPGVGSFGDAMSSMAQRGLVETVKDAALSGRPFLGICLGLQLLFNKSEESPNAQGLGLLGGEIVSIPQDTGLKVPHIGWNAMEIVPGRETDPLFKYVKNGEYVYYVHSYYAKNCAASTLATSEYSIPVTGAVRQGLVYGTQFHPEKSGDAGLRLLKAFAEL